MYIPVCSSFLTGEPLSADQDPGRLLLLRVWAARGEGWPRPLLCGDGGGHDRGHLVSLPLSIFKFHGNISLAVGAVINNIYKNTFWIYIQKVLVLPLFFISHLSPVNNHKAKLTSDIWSHCFAHGLRLQFKARGWHIDCGCEGLKCLLVTQCFFEISIQVSKLSQLICFTLLS